MRVAITSAMTKRGILFIIFGLVRTRQDVRSSVTQIDNNKRFAICQTFLLRFGIRVAIYAGATANPRYFFIYAVTRFVVDTEDMMAPTVNSVSNPAYKRL